MTQRFRFRHTVSTLLTAGAGLTLAVAMPGRAGAVTAVPAVPAAPSAPTAAQVASLRFLPVMHAAGSVVGHPYRWGGASPGGFDCSGLVRWSFASVGVDLPHSSAALRSSTVPVAEHEARAGDLVFFGTPTHHVGIYMGAGLMIHSPSSGKSVHISPVHRVGTPAGYGRVK